MSSLTRPAFDISLIAFYLPQFYPFPENDRWWGKGFTEWTNVTKAQPLFPGHYQPHLPTDLGFYDLRVAETRREQASLAKRYGIAGFCYHYYWFGGKRLLDKPLEGMLQDKELDMPFCLCWANENWTRRWDAAEHEILIAQDYSAQDDVKFIDDLLPYLSDPRYIQIDGACFLTIYRPQQIPELERRADVWRKRAQSHGLRLHLCAALTHGNQDYTQFGFDSGVEFPPHNLSVGTVNKEMSFFEPFGGSVVEYERIARSYLDRQYKGGNVHRTVFPSWDNTARKHNNAVVILDGTPANFELWLRKTVEATAHAFPDQHRLIFINAWNEWAEGCHLEPDRKYGRQFLEAIDRVIEGRSNVREFTTQKRRADPERVVQNRAAEPIPFPPKTVVNPKKGNVAWKVKRELRRIGLQVAHGKFRVPMQDSGVLVLDRVEPMDQQVAGLARSKAPDLSTFMDYEYEVDLTSDHAAAQVINLVGSEKRVLEIGAGSGAITRHLVHTNQCSVAALEINPESCRKLRSFTSEIYDVDLNGKSWTKEIAKAGPFDVVVAADVLEHLYDPWTVLKGMKSLLKEGGSVILSLPHAGHCTVAACLLQEDLDYREWGLLDKTHIRFFGIHNIQTLYESAGMAITDARFVVREPEETEFAERWRMLSREARHVLRQNRFSTVYQVVTKAAAQGIGVRPVALHEMPVRR